MIQSKKVKYAIFVLISVVISSLLYAISVTCFINAPGSDLLPAGVSGLATIISRYIIANGNVSRWYSIIYLGFNIPLFVIAYKYIGKWFSLITFLNVILTSAFIAIMPHQIANWLKVSTMPILDISLFAAVLSGFSIGIALMANASTGGTDIISLFFSIKKGTSIGRYIRLFNAVVIVLGAALSKNLNAMVYTIVYLTLETVVIDLVYNRTKKVLIEIVTSKGEDIKNALLASSIHHGITLLSGKGGYSNENKEVLQIVISSRQTRDVIKQIKDIDEASFVVQLPVDQVYGRFYIPAFK